MKRVAVSISKNGKSLAITVLSDDQEPAGIMVKDIDQLTVIDRRMGNTAILSGHWTTEGIGSGRKKK